ncbi:hypothetical protein SD074_27100 [Prolixibacter sp. SD074]|nr:hypothetical protein SD074_27100 [Prolixibacter sp. SD074]
MTFRIVFPQSVYAYLFEYVSITSVGTELVKEMYEAGKVYAKAPKQSFFRKEKYKELNSDL